MGIVGIVSRFSIDIMDREIVGTDQVSVVNRSSGNSQLESVSRAQLTSDTA